MRMLEGNDLRAKQYFRHLIKEKGAVAKVAKEVKRPEGMSKSALERRIYNTIALNNRSRLSQETAELLAPVLGKTVDELMNPPPSFVPSENGQPAEPEKMDESELISLRGGKLADILARSGPKGLENLVEKIEQDADSRLAMKDLLDMVLREQMLLPQNIAQLMVDHGVIKEETDILLEYTDGEDRELGLGKYAPKPVQQPRERKPPKVREEAPATPTLASAPAETVSGDSGRQVTIKIMLSAEQISELVTQKSQEISVRLTGEEAIMTIHGTEIRMDQRKFVKKYLYPA